MPTAPSENAMAFREKVYALRDAIDLVIDATENERSPEELQASGAQLGEALVAAFLFVYTESTPPVRAAARRALALIDAAQ